MNSSVSPYCALRFSLSAQKNWRALALLIVTLLLFPLGLFVGLLLSRWAVRLDVAGSGESTSSSDRAAPLSAVAVTQGRRLSFLRWLLASPVRQSLWPVLSLSIGIWLPAALCIYREAPDWSFLYLLPPDRATPVFLAVVFTVIGIAIPTGFILGLFWLHRIVLRGLQAVSSGTKERGDAQRVSKLWRLLFWLLVSLPLLGTLLAMRAGSERLFWVGSYADFHDGRWLLLPLIGGSQGSLRLLGIVALALLAMCAGCLVTLHALWSGRTGRSKRASSDEISVSSSGFQAS